MSFLSHLFPPSSSRPIPPPPAPAPDDIPVSCPQDPPPPRMRLTLTPYPHVYGHPPRAPGGVLSLRAVAPVDLEFLGLPAIPADEVPPASAEEEEEEEAFCERMRLLGAEWRESSSSERGSGGRRAKTVVGVGFEGGVEAGRRGEGRRGGGGDGGGGVWVYRVAQGRNKRADGEDWEAARERMMVQWRRCARVEAARTMEERCRVIRECGGEYFESVEAWRKVAMEEHVREGIVDDLVLDEEEEELRALLKQHNDGRLE